MKTYRTQHNRRQSARYRQGVLSLELLIVLPILLIVMCAVVQFTMLLMASQTVHAAAAAGAREAALPGATAQTVQHRVQEVVENWRFADSLAPVEIYVNDQPEYTYPLYEAVPGDVVRVNITVDALATTPDLLQFIGLSLRNEKLNSTFVMRKE